MSKVPHDEQLRLRLITIKEKCRISYAVLEEYSGLSASLWHKIIHGTRQITTVATREVILTIVEKAERLYNEGTMPYMGVTQNKRKALNLTALRTK